MYAEGSRRYLDALSTYIRRRMTRAPRAQVDEVLHIPAAPALHQRPGVPGIRSTFGTGSELPNTLRLMFSRLANHCCPNGHYLEPALDVAAENICESFRMAAKRLMNLGLGYLSLDRAASTLSIGKRQRIQLARAVRNRTAGVHYVLDRPFIR